jgi:hypothetical protein
LPLFFARKSFCCGGVFVCDQRTKGWNLPGWSLHFAANAMLPIKPGRNRLQLHPAHRPVRFGAFDGAHVDGQARHLLEHASALPLFETHQLAVAMRELDDQGVLATDS